MIFLPQKAFKLQITLDMRFFGLLHSRIAPLIPQLLYLKLKTNQYLVIVDLFSSETITFFINKLSVSFEIKNVIIGLISQSLRVDFLGVWILYMAHFLLTIMLSSKNALLFWRMNVFRIPIKPQTGNKLFSYV